MKYLKTSSVAPATGFVQSVVTNEYVYFFGVLPYVIILVFI
jgi:hypothetical protein